MVSVVPCRLYFLFARASPVAVIFRRGPTRWVQVIRWNTATDQFDPGHWFHGRIYERRCDLSPSGELMVYFASKQNEQQAESDYSVSWTAVSKPPWLTALALWPKGDCWAGGGMFADDRTLLLNQGDEPHPKHNPLGHLAVRVQYYCGGGDLPLLANRLVRDGWVQEDCGRWAGWKKADPPESWTRTQPNGAWQAARRLHGFLRQKSGLMRTWDETFAVRSPDRQTEIPLPKATWVDWDQRGRLVLARDGCIVAATWDADGQITEQLLADFNSTKPAPIAAPAWANEW